MDFLAAHGLDIATTVLGIAYIVLEYRASIWLWIVGIVMPALDVWLYWSHGLYGDAGMAVYYTVAAVYGYAVWKWGHRETSTGERHLDVITRFPLRRVGPVLLFFAAAWLLTYQVLVHFTNSTIPVTDSFTNALSFVGLWMLSRKYIEQWGVWIVVDVVSTILYINKGIPFKAGLYGLYVVIAVAGYFKWRQMMRQQAA